MRLKYGNRILYFTRGILCSMYIPTTYSTVTLCVIRARTRLDNVQIVVHVFLIHPNDVVQYCSGVGIPNKYIMPSTDGLHIIIL